MSRVVLLSNPKGRTNARRGLARADALARAAGIPHYTATTPDEIEAALVKIAVKNPEILAINGGDGTVVMAVNLMRTKGMFAREPILALIKGGTTNMIHRDAGLRGKPAEALKTLIDLLAGDAVPATVERQPLIVSREGKPPEHGFFFGAGAIPRAILAARRSLHRRRLTGPFSEALTLGAILAKLRFRRSLKGDAVLAPCDLGWRHENAGERQIFVAATTLKRLILSMEAPATRDHLGVLYMTEAERRLRRAALPALALSPPEPWVLDGEFFPPGPLTISTGAPLRFIIGHA